MDRRSRMRVAAAVLLCALTHLALLRHFEHGPDRDPDRHYHLALSRMTSETGLLRALPQVTGLCWDREFVDKEFLFHALTSLGYALAGERGAEATVPILAIATLSTLVVAAGTTSVVAAALLSPYLMMRMLLMRPHLVGMLAFWLLVLALLRRSRAGALAAGMMFALGYHAIYMPLAAVGVALIVGRGRDAKLVVAAGYGALGVALGTVLNPYFPGTVLLSLDHLVLALDPSVSSTLRGGAELAPRTVPVFLREQGMHLLALLVCAWMVRGRLRDDVNLRFALLLDALLWSAAMQSPRAGEYAIPATALLLGMVLREGAVWSRALVVTVAVLQFPGMVRFVQHPPPVEHTRRSSVEAAITHIPEQGALLLNCEWDTTPHVLYQRPDLKFLDVLDPVLLQTRDPELAGLRAQFRDGVLPDMWWAARHVVKAGYALCSDAAAVQRMEADPAFTRVYPEDFADIALGSTVTLYRVEPERPGRWVTSWKAALLPPLVGDAWRAVPPDVPLQGTVAPSEKDAAWLDLSSLQSAPEGQTRCAVLEPSALPSGKWLGVGGGRNVRVFFNGAPLFASLTAYQEPRLIHALIPLGEKGVLRIVVCSDGGAPFHGIALSAWEPDEVERVCAPRRNSASFPPDVHTWKFPTTQPRTCLAPIAAGAER